MAIGLDADDETGADDRRDDLRDEARPLRAGDAEEADGDEHGDGGRQRRERGEHEIGQQPVRAVVDDQHVDDGAREQAGEQQRGRRR